MGSFNINCQISNTPIKSNDEAILLFVEPPESNQSITSPRILTFPLFVIYNDYGFFKLNPEKTQENNLAIKAIKQASNGQTLKHTAIDDDLYLKPNRTFIDKSMTLLKNFSEETFNDIMSNIFEQSKISFIAIHQNIYQTMVTKTLNHTIEDDVIVYENYMDAVINHYKTFSIKTTKQSEMYPFRKDLSIQAIDCDISESTYTFNRWYYEFIEDSLKDSINNLKFITEAAIFRKLLRKLAIPINGTSTTTEVNTSVESVLILTAELENLRKNFEKLLYEGEFEYYEIANISTNFQKNIIEDNYYDLEPSQMSKHLTIEQILEILSNHTKIL